MTAGSRRLRSTVWLVAASALGIAVLLALGTWQLERLAWKEGLIRDVAARAGATPVPAPPEAEWPSLTRDDIEYRRLALAGTFLHEKEVHVFTDLPDARGPSRGIGVWVMTPLQRDDGSIILVNRGFVPQNRTDPATRASGQVPGRVEIVGLARWSEERNSFTPADDPAKGAWYTRDPAAIAAALGLTHVAPFFVDAQTPAPGGLPQAGETRLVFPNRHLEYALTWYGLAATLAAMAGLALWRRRRS